MPITTINRAITSNGGTPSEDKGVIDYIWIQNPECGQGIAVRNYFTVTDQMALISSDHCPKIADIIID